MLSNLKPLSGFMSYATIDDDYSERGISDFRNMLQLEMGNKLLVDVQIFQDIFDIKQGDDLEAAIRDACHRSSFFVACLTKNFLASEWCPREVLYFKEAHSTDELEALPFPIRWEKDFEIPKGKKDEVTKFITRRRLIEFSDWLTLDGTARELKVVELAQKIIHDLRTRQPDYRFRGDDVDEPPSPDGVERGQGKRAGRQFSSSLDRDEARRSASGGQKIERRPISSSFAVVGDDASDDFKNIADAIKAVPEGAEILIKPGRYLESLVLDRSVVLTRHDRTGDVVVEGVDGPAISISAQDARVEGLTLMGGGTWLNCALWITAGASQIEDCSFHSSNFSCVEIRGGATRPELRRCRFLQARQSGLFVHRGAQPLLEDCEISGARLAGVQVSGASTYATLRRCEFSSGNKGGVYVFRNGTALLIDCAVSKNQLSGVEVADGGDATLIGCRVEANDDSGLYVRHGARVRVLGGAILGNGKSGVRLLHGGAAEIKDARIEENARYGVRAADEHSGARLSRGSLRRNAMGPTGTPQGFEKNINFADRPPFV